MKHWLLATRPKTLLAAFVPVGMATAMAVGDGGGHWPSAAAALFGAICIQIGTNFFNDYADARQGADTAARKGPTRAVATGLISARAMFIGTCLVFGLAALCCAYLVWRTDWRMAVLGAASIGCGFWYTAGKKSLAYLGIADIFVIAFFGPIAVCGTYFAQRGYVPWHVVIAGFAPGLIATGLLAVNNLRDIEEDRAAEKRTLAVRFGPRFARIEYTVCVVTGVCIPLLLWPNRFFSLLGLIALLPVFFVLWKLWRGATGRALNRLLGLTAFTLLFYGVLFSAGWLIG